MSFSERSPGVTQDAFPLQFNEELAMHGSATDRTSPDFVVIHPLDPEDAAITTAMRAMASSTKGVPRGIEARGQHPFPAATDDVLACYRGLPGSGVRRIALTGDSAGGNLALVLASRVTGEAFLTERLQAHASP